MGRRTYLRSGLLFLFLMACLWPSVAWAQDMDYDYMSPAQSYRGRVLEVVDLGETGSSFWGEDGRAQLLSVRITSGDLKGQVIEVEHLLTGNPAYDVRVSPGDEVLLGVDAADGQILNAYIMDFARDRSLAWMLGIFLLAVLLVGGLKGLRSMVVLALTGLAVFFILIPAVLSGLSPVLATVLVSAGVILVGLVIISGPNKKTVAAILGTISGVVVAGLMASFFGSHSNLLGLGSQEAQMLMFASDLSLDFRGLLFAGMILGSLGAVMDVGMSIASAVEEVHQANPRLSFWELVRSGMNVGRDVLGTMANTLILAYAGASLPLLLLLAVYHTEWVTAVNLDIIATEVVRALSGSTGLVASIPVTAAVAGLLKSKAGALRTP